MLRAFRAKSICKKRERGGRPLPIAITVSKARASSSKSLGAKVFLSAASPPSAPTVPRPWRILLAPRKPTRIISHMQHTQALLTPRLSSFAARNLASHEHLVLPRHLHAVVFQLHFGKAGGSPPSPCSSSVAYTSDAHAFDARFMHRCRAATWSTFCLWWQKVVPSVAEGVASRVGVHLGCCVCACACSAARETSRGILRCGGIR